MKQNELCGVIIALHEEFRGSEELNFWGEKMFELFVQDGLPPEITKDKLKEINGYTARALAYIVHVYLNKSTEHKIKSGITKENLEKMQLHNNKIMEGILLTGDFKTL